MTTQKPQAGGGLLRAHARDALALPPELMRVDLVSFPVTIAPDGRVTGASLVPLHGEYAGELFSMSAYGTAPELAPWVNINLREDGRNFDLFTTPVDLAHLQAGNGRWGMSFPRAAYVFRPGARIRITYRIEPEYVAQATAPARWSVLLALNLWRETHR